jgi:hypothetical protein
MTRPGRPAGTYADTSRSSTTPRTPLAVQLTKRGPPAGRARRGSGVRRVRGVRCGLATAAAPGGLDL